MALKEGSVSTAWSEQDRDSVEVILSRFRNMRGGLIPALHEIQKVFGYLPEPALQMTSDALSVPMTEIYGVATFYSLFSLQPQGRHVIHVCLGTACYVRGARKLVEKLSDELHADVGETTTDERFTLQAVRCLGACGLAPVVEVDGTVYGKLTAGQIQTVLSRYE